MGTLDMIAKKRDKRALTGDEINDFVQGYTRGDIPDYQAAAFLMAVFINGMTERETVALTLAMADSGKQLALMPDVVDKHSTGGVGDKTTLVVAPVVAACGQPVGKMSGRGLGFSGGTVDKLESIPGYRTDLSIQEFSQQLREIGLVLTGQSVELAPADGKLYALRDATGTVESLPLIAASIMSKKIAAGAGGIVLDVKWGLGAFMQTLDDARSLARLMQRIADGVGRRSAVLLSDMNQPLGCAVGNALELKEAIGLLTSTGKIDAGFREHCLTVAAHMLALGNHAVDVKTGYRMAQDALQSGAAWEHFRRVVARQGGDLAVIDDPSLLPNARRVETIPAPHSGYLRAVNARIVGETAVRLGAGRAKKGDPIDRAVGIIVHHKVGDQVTKGDPLAAIHANDETKLQVARQSLLEAHTWSDTPVERLPLFY
ncbi:MAG: thymidine phosphorylase [Anaerolineales bacterium]